jgi:hypothetical protein
MTALYFFSSEMLGLWPGLRFQKSVEKLAAAPGPRPHILPLTEAPRFANRAGYLAFGPELQLARLD